MQKLLILFIILLVSGCGNQTIRPDKPEYPGLQSAKMAYANKNYELASRLYSELFNQYSETQFAVKVADSFIQQQRFSQAEQWAAKVAPTNDPLHLIVLTELAININDGNKASYFFNQIGSKPNKQLLQRYLLNQSIVAKFNKDYLTSAIALIELDQLQGQNQRLLEIMSLLQSIPENSLSQDLFSSNWSDIELGYLEAAYISQSQDSTALDQWKSRWGNHPALEYFLSSSSFQKLAVLLPFSGRYKTISQTIQQGMIAALDSIDNEDMEVEFFDTGSAGESFSNAWYSAVESGAEFLIGPLEKNSISQLKSMNSITLPTMILNQLDTEDNSYGVYQFPLLPEDEAISVAKRLVAEGKRRVLVLAPNTESGKKLLDVFQNEYSFESGRVINQALYPSNAKDFSNELKSVLGLLDSKARIRKLQKNLGVQLESEPQVRPDIDAIVLFANSKLARLIKPQLKFFKAENVPVYSTSQIFTGSVDTTKDSDLNGILFSQSRFISDSKAYDELLGFDTGSLALNKKFFAFGYDSIMLSSKVDWMLRQSGRQYLGLSGELSMDSNAMIHRNLSWAEFNRGQPRYVEDVQLESEMDDSENLDEDTSF